jgi:phospholipase/carboxylesterase
MPTGRTQDEPLLDTVEVVLPSSPRAAAGAAGAGGERPAPGAAVVWMHGLGADGHDFESIVPHLGLPPDLGVRFVFPHAPPIPVTLNGGMVMRAWYDLVGQDLRRLRHDEAGIRRSARHIERLVERERARGVPPGRVVLAGFSQGGAMALFLGLRYPERLAGVLALSSFLPLPETLEAERSDANRNVPVLVCHGTHDPMVPEEFGRRTHEQLVRLGYPSEYEVYPMQHEVCMEEVRRVGRWLTDRLGADGAV